MRELGIIAVGNLGALWGLGAILLACLVFNPKRRGIGINPPPIKPRPSIKPTPQRRANDE